MVKTIFDYLKDIKSSYFKQFIKSELVEYINVEIDFKEDKNILNAFKNLSKELNFKNKSFHLWYKNADDIIIFKNM